MGAPFRTPLQYGGGLERASGFLAADPRSMRDLRNVYPYRGKIEVRGGHTSKLDLSSITAGITDAVAVHALRSEQIGVAVGYNNATRELRAFRTEGDLSSGTDLGSWATVGADAVVDPPRVIMAESLRRAYMAHDEPRINERAQTFRYEGFGASTLDGLTQEWADSGEEPIKFRGVVAHLDYLVGWGYGDATGDRPELVRVSLPGQPSIFRPNHYAIVGARGDPVLSCVPWGNTLLMLKGSEAYELVGYSRATFGVRPVDLRFGVGASRLALNLGGSVFAWGLEGPRIFPPGSASRDIAVPLDLAAPAPSDLAAEGELEAGFALYVPERRAILWYFGRRVYALNLYNPSSPEWAYWELPATFEPFCGGLVYSGGEVASGAAPEGHPEFDSATPSDIAADTVWDLIDSTGDEVLEVWTQPAGGSWELDESIAVESDAQQTVVVDGPDDDKLLSGTAYEVAARFRRGALFTEGYEGSDPDLWPAVSKGSFTTGLLPPTEFAVEWARESSTVEHIRLTWTNAYTDRQTEVYGKLAGDPDFTLLATVAADTAEYDHTNEHASKPLIGESNWTYYVRHVSAAEASADTSQLMRWAGPDFVTGYSAITGTALGSSYEASWTDVPSADADSSYEIHDRNDTDADPSFALQHTEPHPSTQPVIVQPSGGGSGDTYSTKIRHKSTKFTVDDFSLFAGQQVVVLSA